jgi:hypothetical protein
MHYINLSPKSGVTETHGKTIYPADISKTGGFAHDFGRILKQLYTQKLVFKYKKALVITPKAQKELQRNGFRKTSLDDNIVIFDKSYEQGRSYILDNALLIGRQEGVLLLMSPQILTSKNITFTTEPPYSLISPWILHDTQDWAQTPGEAIALNLPLPWWLLSKKIDYDTLNPLLTHLLNVAAGFCIEHYPCNGPQDNIGLILNTVNCAQQPMAWSETMVRAEVFPGNSFETTFSGQKRAIKTHLNGILQTLVRTNTLGIYPIHFATAPASIGGRFNGGSIEFKPLSAHQRLPLQAHYFNALESYA